ncbi:hypothetical protein BBP00_00009582, partial [Phytophthora kernoviae]
MNNPAMDPHDWSPGAAGAVTDKIWAQAIHSVAGRQLSLRQAAQLYGVQHSALHRLVRQHTLQHLRTPPPTPFRPSGTSSILSNSDGSRLAVATTITPTSNSCNSKRDTDYVFPRLNTLALGHVSPKGTMVLPAVSTVSPRSLMTLTSPPDCELTPELNDEVVAVLRDQFMQQSDGGYEAADGRYSYDYGRLEGYANADIADVVRTIVGCNGRRPLASGFPSARWLTMFKRENDFVDVDGMRRCHSNTNNDRSVRNSFPSQLQQQQHPRYKPRYALEQQQQLELELERGGDQLRWLRMQQNRNYRQPAAPPPSPPLQHSPIYRRSPYSWDAVSVVRTDTGGGSLLSPPPPPRPPQPHQQVRYGQPPRQERDGVKCRRSPSLTSSNGHSDGNTSDRSYRHSNMVPPEVWESAMEAVAIHGMSLRNAAKAHGVHFAALHRRLKKRQQHKLNMPCGPNYIPFEDEAGVVRVIHARADMGVQLTFAELVDLLKRTALKHRSAVPADIATALVCKFQSRVEQSVRHLIIDWPSLPDNVLYHLGGTSGGDGNKDDVGTGKVTAGNPV